MSSRLAVRTAQQTRHLLLEAVVERFLRRRLGVGTGRGAARRPRALGGAARARGFLALGRLRSRRVSCGVLGSTLALRRPAQRGFEPLRHFREILVGGRRVERGIGGGSRGRGGGRTGGSIGSASAGIGAGARESSSANPASGSAMRGLRSRGSGGGGSG